MGHEHMMSTLGGGGDTPKADKSTDKLRECDSDKGGGGAKPENTADVICTCPLMRIAHRSHAVPPQRRDFQLQLQHEQDFSPQTPHEIYT